MRMMVKNGPPFNLSRASFTDNYELITDNFIISGSFTCCVIIVQPQIDLFSTCNKKVI